MKRRLASPEQALESLKRRMAKHARIDESGCVIWTSSLTRGYGYVNFWNGERGVPLRAHRVAYALAHDLPVQFDGVVMHTCDNTACVNAAHLRLGTQADNMADKTAKTRQQRGAKCPYAKLDESAVRLIRSDPRSAVDLAALYGVSDRTIGDVRRRKIWKHVA